METVSLPALELFFPPTLPKQSTSRKECNKSNHKLPTDPRQWSREHVHQWLQLVASAHGLVEVKPSRFAMNGKALCLMTPAMFAQRVPLGGKLLYRDFQLRLSLAIHSNQR